MYSTKLTHLLSFAVLATCRCGSPNPAFPVPSWPNAGSALQPTFEQLKAHFDQAVQADKFENTSFSIEVTSQTETLWGHHHTAVNLNRTRPGDTDVSADSQFRIASITKTFTTLAILYQHATGKVNLDDPVTKYIPKLNSSAYAIPWKDITLRSLASQLSGIPREFAQSDIWNDVRGDPTSIGLPPDSGEGLPNCDEYNYYKPCNRSDLFEQLKHARPIFAPNQRSTYSNLNFELLGLVLEAVTGKSYEEVIEDDIFKPLGMASSTLTKPKSDDKAVLPILKCTKPNFWDIELGIQAPTGGIYSSTHDLSRYLRHILATYNSPAELGVGVNWLHPASFSTGANTFYGMPWEILSSEDVVESGRRVTYTTKSGGLPGYTSRIYLIEEFGLGISILLGGDGDLFEDLQNPLTVDLIQAAEAQIWEDVQSTYSGSFTATQSSLNSSAIIAVDPIKGLHVTSFISNGTDVLTALFLEATAPMVMQLSPTYLLANQSAGEGEIFRLLPNQDQNQASSSSGKGKSPWDDFCLTDVDPLAYAGKPVNEIVFWHGEELLVELPAWNLTLKREGEGKRAEKLALQQHVDL